MPWVSGHNANLSTVNYEGFEAPVCPNASCRDRCGDKDALYCACDEHCMILGICCIDYQAQCISNTSFEDSNITQEFLDRYKIQQSSKCFLPISGGRTSPAFQTIIVKCPYFFQGSRELCENITYSKPTPSTILMVYTKSPGLIYKNQYCAQCHGFKDWIPINMHIHGDRILDAITIAKNQEVSALLAETLNSFPTLMFRFNLRPLSLDWPRFQCHRFTGYKYDDCDSNSIPLVSEFINSYKSPIINNLIQTKRRNWHWEKYNCLKFDPKMFACSSGRYISFGIFLPFNHLVVTPTDIRYGSGHAFCYHNQIADVLSNKCIARPCPIGSRSLYGACHAVATNAYIVPRPLNANQLTIVLALNMSTSIAFLKGPLLKIFHGANILEWESIDCGIISTSQPSAFCVTVRLIGKSSNLIFSGLSHKYQREELFQLLHNSLPNVSNIALLNYDPINGVSCPYGKLVWSYDSPIVTNATIPDFRFSTGNLIKVVIAGTLMTYSVDTLAVKLSWLPQLTVNVTEQSVHYLGQASVATCMDKLSLASCDTAMLMSHQYTADVGFDTAKLSLNSGNPVKHVTLSSEQIIITENATLILCKAALEKFQQNASTSCKSCHFEMMVMMTIAVIHVVINFSA